jgi:hypothetical protein
MTVATSSEVERTHGPECDCTRCRGFQAGHELSTRHGAYALLQLRPRADEIAGDIRASLGDGYDARFEGAIAGAAMTGAQLERAMGALADARTAAELNRLDQDARGWMRLWFSALGALGLTPTSASRLRLNEALDPGAELRAHLERKYAATPTTEGDD